MKNFLNIDKSEKLRILEMHNIEREKTFLLEELPQFTNPEKNLNPLNPQPTLNTAIQTWTNYFKNYPCVITWAAQPSVWSLITNYSIMAPNKPSFTLKNFVVFYNDGTFMTISDKKVYKWDCDWFNTNLNSFISSQGKEGLPKENKEYGEYQGENKQYTFNQNVVTFQNALNMIGYNTGKSDGKFGPKTKKALEQFQDEYNLSSSRGKMNSATADKMIEVLQAEKPDESTQIQNDLAAVQ